MPVPSRVALLPDPLRTELEQWIITHGFAGYETAAAWLAERGQALGIDAARLPKRSALQEYGAKLKRKMQSIAASTEASRLIAELFPDDADSRSAATMALVNTELFNVLLALQDVKDADAGERVKLLVRVAQAIAPLSRASINQKKWQAAIWQKAEDSATRAERIAKRGGLSEAATNDIRRLILGIAA